MGGSFTARNNKNGNKIIVTELASCFTAHMWGAGGNVSHSRSPDADLYKACVLSKKSEMNCHRDIGNCLIPAYTIGLLS